MVCFQRWRLLFWLMLFAWFSVAQKLSEQINDVEKMMSHFKDITDPMADLLTRLGSVGSKIAPFAELAFSVGSLVAGTLHVAGHTESDEYKALMLLNATTTVQFKKNEETVRLSQKLLDGGLQMGVYNREIRDQLDILHSEMKMMWNPNLDKTQAVVNVFKHTCLQRNPKDLLLVIHGMTVRGCHRLPTRRDVQILAEARQVFRDIKLYNVINIAYTMHHIKSQFEEDKESVIATLQAHSNSSDELLEEIKWAFTSKVWKLEDAMKKIKQVFANRRITVKPTNCLTRTMVEATNYRYLEAMEFSDLLIKDMARAVVFAGSCANLTYGGNQKVIAEHKDEVVELMHSIVVYMNKYMRLQLEMAWPEAHMTEIKDFIGKTTIIGSQKVYQETVQNISKKVEAVGLPNYYYQLVLATYEDPTTGMVTEGDSKWIFTMAELGGADLIVSRFPKQDLYRMLEAQDWLVSVRAKITSVIDYNYNVGRLDNLLERIKLGANTTLTADNRYHSIAITRDYSIIQGSCQVVFGQTITSISGIGQASNFIEYYWRGEPIFKNCEHFVLFFFCETFLYG